MKDQKKQSTQGPEDHEFPVRMELLCKTTEEGLECELDKKVLMKFMKHPMGTRFVFRVDRSREDNDREDRGSDHKIDQRGHAR